MTLPQDSGESEPQLLQRSVSLVTPPLVIEGSPASGLPLVTHPQGFEGTVPVC